METVCQSGHLTKHPFALCGVSDKAVLQQPEVQGVLQRQEGTDTPCSSSPFLRIEQPKDDMIDEGEGEGTKFN
jgi:hypothetical protein